MTITINGKQEQIDSANLLPILAQKQVDPAHVVVVINDEVIQQDQYEHITLAQDDRVEILHFVSGG